MGAYYNGAVECEDGNKIRFDSWKSGEGLKLMEHSYIGNKYVSRVMDELLDNPKELSWICDYSDDGYYNWDNFKECEDDSPIPKITPTSKYYIYNHSKGVMINISELIRIQSGYIF